ncbi:hypothetical protein HJG44_17815 [Enterovirga sp. DB1703]|uniref:Isoprenylcysteine carboxylmethyltransferase family protein n=1 Tax=Enterovirga aerilata TaxID=2730920 RepID=A0A849IDC3_9HYPH|nr:hypothetical protein [Enterovirga sp. DB1703]
MAPLLGRGLFARSRNPVFLGHFASYVGLLPLLPNVVQLVLSFVLVLATRIQVHVEEDMLEEEHGASYLRYKQRVRRWI